MKHKKIVCIFASMVVLAMLVGVGFRVVRSIQVFRLERQIQSSRNRGDDVLGEQLYDALIALEPTPAHYLSRSRFFMDRERYEQSIDDLNTAVSLSKKADPDAYAVLLTLKGRVTGWKYSDLVSPLRKWGSDLLPIP